MVDVKVAKLALISLTGLFCVAALFPDVPFVAMVFIGALVAIFGLIVPYTRWVVLLAGAYGMFKYGQFLAEHKESLGPWPGYIPAFILALQAVLSYRRQPRRDRNRF